MSLCVHPAAAACEKLSRMLRLQMDQTKIIHSSLLSSVVWKSFGFRREQIIHKECMRLVSVPQNNTTNLFNHLKKHHKRCSFYLTELRASDISLQVTGTRLASAFRFSPSQRHTLKKTHKHNTSHTPQRIHITFS